MRFSCRRERLLWTAAALWLTAIYLSLNWARSLAALLRGAGLLRLAVYGLLALAAAVAVGVVLRESRGVRTLAVLAGAGAGYAALLPVATGPEEQFHLLEYGLLAVLVHAALRARAAAEVEPAGPPAREAPREAAVGRPSVLRRPALAAVLVTAYAGWVDEGIQDLLPGRHYDFRDVLLNAAAAVLAVATATALTRFRAPGSPEVRRGRPGRTGSG